MLLLLLPLVVPFDGRMQYYKSASLSRMGGVLTTQSAPITFSLGSTKFISLRMSIAWTVLTVSPIYINRHNGDIQVVDLHLSLEKTSLEDVVFWILLVL